MSFRCDLNFALVLLFATCYMHHCVILKHVIMIPDCVIFQVLLKFWFGVENLCETSPSAHNIIVKMSEINLQLKPHIILSFVCSYFFNWQIFPKLCTEHGNITAMLCAKFRKNLSTEIYLLVNKIVSDLSSVRFGMDLVYWNQSQNRTSNPMSQLSNF